MSNVNKSWSGSHKILFRFFFLYFLIQIIPLDWKFYQLLFSIHWTQLYYGDIFLLAHYHPQFIPGGGFYNWLLVAAIAATGTVIWTLRDRERDAYDTLYYWLRVLVRYRLAAGVIAYGFIKLFPLQSPALSLSTLNTRYGEFTDWKVFSVSLGAAPLYESFLGFVEILAGLLLLWRKTASIGSFIIIAFAGNVFLSNIAYEGGEYEYAAYLLVMALFLFAYDAGRLYNLVQGKPASPDTFRLQLPAAWQRRGRVILKTGFVLFFIVLYGAITYEGYRHDPHNVVTTPGLPGAYGVYNVSLFRIGKDTLPYSQVDTTRWQDVIFEKWATLSIKSNRPVVIDSTNVEQIHRDDLSKTYESVGTNGRRYYAYSVDSAAQALVLKNKNPHYAGEQLVLHYHWPTASRLVLEGVNENKDSIYVVLDRLDKKYLLVEGRRKPQTL
ncbi:MAG TPA: DoxX family protein [Chitinophaga sp.]